MQETFPIYARVLSAHYWLSTASSLPQESERMPEAEHASSLAFELFINPYLSVFWHRVQAIFTIYARDSVLLAVYASKV
jgi:hypothetical protein